MVRPLPKPTYRKHRARRNPCPTAEDVCIYDGRPYASTHEIFGGKNRQNSIKYKMQVKLCNDCHRDIQTHPMQGRDLELKLEFQAKFEQEHSRDEFVRVFGKNYL